MNRCLPLAALLLLAAAVRADDAADARKIVEKGITAQGRKVGDKLKAATWKGKGTFYGMGAELPYTGNWSVQYPDKTRMEIENAFTVVVAGAKGWISAGGNTMEMTKEQVAEQQEEQHADFVSELLPLTDKAFTLAPAGEIKVDGKPALGVKVSHKGRRDVTLYFDKDTGLLAKVDQTVKDEMSGQEMKQETFIKSYIKVGDVKVAGKMEVKRDGKMYVDGEAADYKFVDKLPPETFEKP